MALNYAGKDKDPELAGKRVDQLRSDGHIAFDAKGAVIYQF